MSAPTPSAVAASHRGIAPFAAVLTVLAVLLPAPLAASEAGLGGAAAGSSDDSSLTTAETAVGHLLLSEVMTGGTSASDEFVEIYNPAPVALPTEGLELIYVSASGATITSKASWAAGAAEVPPGRHLLVANAAGLFAAIADLTYANGLSAAGGSLALRVQGASTAVDAVGWGTAANAWMEGAQAPAAASGHSLERLPGGTDGSFQDTDQNAVDFIERNAPDPQNSASPPVPATTPTPTPSDDASPAPTLTPPSATVPPTPATTPTPAATPPGTPAPPTTSPTPTGMPGFSTVAEARALPDGSQVTIEAASLTDGAFADGGGYVADATAGIALLISDGTFPRGMWLRATGVIDDRYLQRTLRAAAADVTLLGNMVEPAPISAATGSIGEAHECRLVAMAGVVLSAPTALSGGLAFDVDDGSGAIRVLVGDAAGIDTGKWVRGATVALRGVVGQRDSSGSGTAGYRVQPRAAADILGVTPPATTPPPAASASPSGPGSSPSSSPDQPIISVASARQASSGTAVRVRGIVTLPSGLVEPGSAVIQDGSGAILVRLGDEAGALARGELVELAGARSTKAGMLSMRVTVPAARLGQQAEPVPMRVATGRLGEQHEALLVVARGAVAGAPRKTSAGNRYFDLDDGSGLVRIFLSARAGVVATGLEAGAWVEVIGVLGQETTGQQPLRGYRIWPRRGADIRIVAAPLGEGSEKDGEAGVAGGAGGVPSTSLPEAAPAMRDLPVLPVPGLGGAVADRISAGGHPERPESAHGCGTRVEPRGERRWAAGGRAAPARVGLAGARAGVAGPPSGTIGPG